jgi:hypothetical protein
MFKYQICVSHVLHCTKHMWGMRIFCGDRSKIWSAACGREDSLQKDATYCYINCTICGLHFEDDVFLNCGKNRLKKDAVPILFIHRAAPNMCQESKGINICYQYMVVRTLFRGYIERSVSRRFVCT